MIPAHARVSVQRIPLECLQVKHYYDEPRNPARVLHYYRLLVAHPDEYPGVLSVVPSNTHPGMYAVEDGHHRLCASILAMRQDALCLVIEESDRTDICPTCGKHYFSEFVAKGGVAMPNGWSQYLCYGHPQEEEADGSGKEWMERGVQRLQRLMTCLAHADDEQCAACGEDA